MTKIWDWIDYQASPFELTLILVGVMSLLFILIIYLPFKSKLMPIDVKIGKMKGKAYTREEYLFKKAHPFRWWLGSNLKRFFQWQRGIKREKIIINEPDNGTTRPNQDINQ